MNPIIAKLRRLAPVLPFIVLPAALPAQEIVSTQPGNEIVLPAPTSLQTDGETPWIYRGSDVPQDKDWLFGEMQNGLRYAVRENGVPPGQVWPQVRSFLAASNMQVARVDARKPL